MSSRSLKQCGMNMKPSPMQERLSSWIARTWQWVDIRPTPVRILKHSKKTIAVNIEVLNHAVRNIPEEQLRMHLCWGNYPGPHHHDVPIADIIDIVWTAKPQTVLVEGANSRHAHEWAVLKELGVPTNKKLCLGLIEPQSNYIEHPELVAQRIQRWAEVVDPERLMAGVDCGFSIHVGMAGIDPKVAWKKLEALGHAPNLRPGYRNRG